MFRLLLDESPESLAAQQQAPIIDSELSAIADGSSSNTPVSASAGQHRNNSNNNNPSSTTNMPSPFHLSSAATPPSQILQSNPFLPSTPLLSTPSPQLPNIFQSNSVTPNGSNNASMNNSSNGNASSNSNNTNITPTQQFMQHHHQHLQQQQQQPSLIPATPTYIPQQRVIQQQQQPQQMYQQQQVVGKHLQQQYQQQQLPYQQQAQQQQQHYQQQLAITQQQQQQQHPAVLVDVVELQLNNRVTSSTLYVPSFFVQDLINANVLAAQNVLQLAQQFDSNSPSVVHISDRNLPDFNENFVACGGATIVQQVPPLLQQQLAQQHGFQQAQQQQPRGTSFRMFDETSTLISFSLLQECANVKLGANILFSTKCNVWYDMNKHRWVVGTDMPVENSAHAPPAFISWVPNVTSNIAGTADAQQQQQHAEYHHGQQFYQQQFANGQQRTSAPKRKREDGSIDGQQGSNSNSPNDSNSPGSGDDANSSAPNKKKQRKQRHVKKVGEIVKNEMGKHVVVVEVAQLQFEVAHPQQQQQQQPDQKKLSDYYLPAGRVGDLAEFLTRDRTSIFRAATRNAFEDDAYPDGVYLTKDTAKKFNHEIGDTFHNYCGVHGRHDASVLIRIELLKEFVKHGYELQPVVIFSKKLYLTYESAGKRWVASESKG